MRLLYEKMPDPSMHVRLLALCVTAMLLASFVLIPSANAAPTVRTTVELGVKVDVSDPQGGTTGDTDEPLPNIVHVGKTYHVYGKISVITDRGTKLPDGPKGATVKLFDTFNSNKPILMATGTTDENGFFDIVWLVEPKTVFKEFNELIKEGINSIENIRLTVHVAYDGDSTYLSSRSQGYNIELRPLRLITSVATDKSVYSTGDSASVTITIRDPDNKLVEPDALSVFYDAAKVTPEKVETGKYSFVVPSLTEGFHKITVLPEKLTYVRESVVSTVMVTAKMDFPVDIDASLDQGSYGVGDPALLSGRVDPALVDRPVLFSVMNPNGAIFNIGQILVGESGTFERVIELAGPQSMPGKWSITITYLGKQVVQEFTVGELRTKFLKVALKSTETIDELGERAERAEVGKPIGIQAYTTNTEIKTINLVYIVKVTDADGFTAMVSWIKVSNLKAGESVRPAIFWIPEQPGRYSADIFVWDNLLNPLPLSPPEGLSLKVV